MSKNYYYLIAGLPEIGFEDGKLSYSIADFIEEISHHLSSSDRKLVDLYRLKFDNANLLKYLLDKEAEFHPLGHFSRTDFEELITAIKDEEPYTRNLLPKYMIRFVKAHVSEKSLMAGLTWEDQLSSLYYAYALKSTNRFVAQWYELNLNIGNILSAQAARKYGLDINQVIVGNNHVAKAIKNVGGRDFGLTGELDYFEQLFRIGESQDLYDRERKIDLLKWKWLEENTFFHYFTIERIFAYLLQLELIERWLLLSKETGEQMFRHMIDQMKQSVEIPQEFKS